MKTFSAFDVTKIASYFIESHDVLVLVCKVVISNYIVLALIQYQILEFTMFLHASHVLNISCVFCTLCPMSVLSCIAHASPMHT